MSLYDVDTIEKPPFFKLGPLKGGRSKRESYVIGFDSEAGWDAPGDGRPFLFQFSLPNTSEEDTLLVELSAEPGNGFARFMEFVARYCTNAKYEYLIYGWNLSYEWTQLFGDEDDDFRSTSELVLPGTVDLDGKITGWEWHIYNDKRVFAEIRNIKRKTMVRVLDGMMFYNTGLDKAAKMLGLGEKSGGIERNKIERRWIIGEEHLRDQFLAYARRDAYITRLVGEHIVRLHQQYDVATCISAPHFASRVFRHHFLGAEIARPDRELEQAGLWSYHGGKNGYYLDSPQLVKGVYQYDITSAYPEAMRQLPNIETAEWRRINDYQPEQHAIYAVTIQHRRCEYNGILNHDGTWAQNGYIEDICITGYELDALMRGSEATIIAVHGWEMVGESGGPLVSYVDEFFRLKSTTEGAERETAKLFLNSLYGKFFQKIALGAVGYLDMETGEIVEHNLDGPFDYRAGGLYHPPIASLITGYVRAKIHNLEHKYAAIMTSTDGMFARNSPDPADIGNHLGGLTVAYGDLSIWRERLYVFAPDHACTCELRGTPCQTCQEPRHALKCPAAPKAAFHGYWGCLEGLQGLPLAAGTYEYHDRRMLTLKDSTKLWDKHRYRAGTFLDRKRTIVLENRA